MSSKNKRLHIAVLIANIGDVCQNAIIDGINDCANKHDIDISVYVGTYQTVDNEFVSHYETCYEIIKNSESLDGLILFTGFITPDEEIDAFTDNIVKIFEHIPTVSVSYRLPGMPTVLANNVNGIFNAVDHLIKVHNKKKIAFIRGPKGHLEAEERLEGYKNALAANGITFEEDYVLPGNFSQERGKDAIKELIDVRKLAFDAIVASDDASALGAINGLKSRGIFVPKDVAVTGFDDDRVATTFTPTLTTVKQDFYKVGEVSTEALIGLISNEDVEKIQYIDGEFISRQSCGCLSEDFLLKKAAHNESWKNSACLRSYAMKECMLLFEDDISTEYICQWVTILIDSIKAKPFCENHFFNAFDEILIDYSLLSNDYLRWFEALDAITAGVGAYSDEVDSLNIILSTLIHATKLVQDACLKFVKELEYELVGARQKLSRVSSKLLIAQDLDSLSDELSSGLPLLSLNSAIIGLYKNFEFSNENELERKIETLIGFSEGQAFKVKCSGKDAEIHSIHALIDKFGIEHERRAQCIFPLFCNEEELGILFLPYDSKISAEVYEAVRMSISSAVKGIQLIMKIHDLSVTDELTGLLNRRGFFQFAQSRLQHLQRNLGLIPLVMLFDIDGLKNINDNFGHKAGDIAIASFAKALQKTLRGEDIVGRMGGDEFVALTSVKSKKDGVKLEQRLRESLAKMNDKKKRKFILDTSIGMATLDEPNAECFEAAMLKADSILYEEKRKKKEKIST